MECVKEIWLEIIHTLKGQYDNIIGLSQEAESKRRRFHVQWKRYPFYDLYGLRPKWCYAAPRWLFPPVYDHRFLTR